MKCKKLLFWFRLTCAIVRLRGSLDVSAMALSNGINKNVGLRLHGNGSLESIYDVHLQWKAALIPPDSVTKKHCFFSYMVNVAWFFQSML